MDVIVTASDTEAVWQLADLLGRPIGRIWRAPNGFYIQIESCATDHMAQVRRGTHASLDAALAEIERKTRRVCRRRH